MKKTILLFGLIAGMVLSSCTEDEIVFTEVIPQTKEPSVAESQIRTVEDALQIVTENYPSIYNQHISRSFSLDPSNVLAVGSNRASRSAASDTAIYVVNIGENNGFAVVSANKDCTPLLALTDNGHISDIDSIDIPGLQMFLYGAVAYSTGGGNLESPKPNDKEPLPMLWHGEAVYPSSCDFGPYVEVAWGQQWPTGYYFSNKISGCAVTAAVQALSYFEKPTSIQLTYPNKDKNVQSIDWPSIRTNVKSESLYPLGFEYIENIEGHYALARISREIGYRINAIDTASITTATLDDLRNFFIKTTPEITISTMGTGTPYVRSMKDWQVIVMGGTITENAKVGHVWIIDGYKDKTELVMEYILQAPVMFDIDGNPVTSEAPIRTYTRIYYSLSHINWGYDGYCNGYYDAGVYDFSKCKEPDGNYWANDITNYKYIVQYFTMNKK